MMLLSEFGRNRNTLTPLCNMKKNMFSRTWGGDRIPSQTLCNMKKTCMSRVCSISPSVGELVLVGGHFPYVPSHLSART